MQCPSVLQMSVTFWSWSDHMQLLMEWLPRHVLIPTHTKIVCGAPVTAHHTVSRSRKLWQFGASFCFASVVSASLSFCPKNRNSSVIYIISCLVTQFQKIREVVKIEMELCFGVSRSRYTLYALNFPANEVGSQKSMPYWRIQYAFLGICLIWESTVSSYFPSIPSPSEGQFRLRRSSCRVD